MTLQQKSEFVPQLVDKEMLSMLGEGSASSETRKRARPASTESIFSGIPQGIDFGVARSSTWPADSELPSMMGDIQVETQHNGKKLTPQQRRQRIQFAKIESLQREYHVDLECLKEYEVTQRRRLEEQHQGNPVAMQKATEALGLQLRRFISHLKFGHFTAVDQLLADLQSGRSKKEKAKSVPSKITVTPQSMPLPKKAHSSGQPITWTPKSQALSKLPALQHSQSTPEELMISQCGLPQPNPKFSPISPPQIPILPRRATIDAFQRFSQECPGDFLPMTDLGSSHQMSQHSARPATPYPFVSPCEPQPFSVMTPRQNPAYRPDFAREPSSRQSSCTTGYYPRAPFQQFPGHPMTQSLDMPTSCFEGADLSQPSFASLYIFASHSDYRQKEFILSYTNSQYEQEITFPSRTHKSHYTDTGILPQRKLWLMCHHLAHLGIKSVWKINMLHLCRADFRNV